MVLSGALLGTTVLFGALLAGYLLVEIPAPKFAAAAQSNVYLYADGSRLAAVGEVNRENVALSEVPRPVRHAVLAAEDRGFYHDPAVDVTAMARAAWNMVRGGGRQSGSTITQQYVKNYYLDQRQTVSRKVKEFFIAIKLGREVSKDEILEGYLNTSYFGRNAYGIQAAARAYYGKDARELDVAEGAYLAALLNAPSAYDVRANPAGREQAEARWEYVLDGMVSEGWLSRSRRERLRFPEPVEITPVTGLSGQRGYLVQAVTEYLKENGIADERQLAAGGYRITTTFQPERQRALTRAVREQLLDRLGDSGPPDSYARAGAASVDTRTGHVVAIYGGEDYTRQYVNGATRRDYQAASTFKPLVYAAALRYEARTAGGERIGPDTRYDGRSGREVIGRDGEGTGFAPENEDQEDFGDLSVSAAMDWSVNSVFAQMGSDVGLDRVKDTAVALGIPADTPGLDSAQGSVTLGTATPSPLDVAEAYATLAAHGWHRPAVLVEKVTREGHEIPLPEAAGARAVPREAADGTTRVLRRVVEGGTGTAARAAGRPAAGKTGTAEGDLAAWFAGYTPELATVVAVFGQDPETGAQRELYGVGGLSRVGGGDFPARIWAAYTADALHGQPETPFRLDGREPSGEPSPASSPTGRASPSEEPATPRETGRPAEPGAGTPTGPGPGADSPTGAPATPGGEPPGTPTGAPPPEPGASPEVPGAPGAEAAAAPPPAGEVTPPPATRPEPSAAPG
nr:transglycosylase domain-containing protein [Streptomyces hoynatensis]